MHKYQLGYKKVLKPYFKEVTTRIIDVAVINLGY
jgi:hypothetical protein